MAAVAEFDEKLNSILGNPDAMAQIMQLAQSLSGGAQTAEAPPPAPSAPPPPQPTFTPRPQQAPPAPAQAAPDLLSSLTGGLDPKLISKLVPLLQELGGQQDSNARALLYALRPYLKPERQEKVERALQLARLFHLGKKFLSEWGG